jgi:hypothetical protein
MQNKENFEVRPEVERLRKLVNRFGWQHPKVLAQVAKLRDMEAQS